MVSEAGSRRARARATRERIVESAFRLMSEQGYSATTLTAVAKDAGVAVQTIYFLFHSKPELLRDAFAYAVQGDHTPVSPGERTWFEKMRAEPNLPKALRILIGAMVEIFRRASPLRSAFQALADDPETAAFHARGEQERHEGYGRILDALSAKARLRPGLDRASATDLLFVLLSPEVYRELVVGRGWPESKYADYMASLLGDSLFGSASMNIARGSSSNQERPVRRSRGPGVRVQ